MAEFTLPGLRVVRQVAATGSFTRAAEVLGYTQSAVSRQVALMETAAGAPIFERGRRGVAVTPAGEVLVRHASEVLAGIAAAELELAGLRDRLAGRLTIGAFPTAAMALVPRAVARVRSGHPGLAVVFTEAATPALLRQVRAGRLDLAVVGVGDGLPGYDLKGLRSTTLTHGTLVVVVPAAHRFADTTTDAELAYEQWIVGEGEPGEPQFGAWPTLPDPRVAYTARSWSTRLGMVAAGLGITVVPGMARPALPNGVRTVKVLKTEWPGRSTLSITRPNQTSQAGAMITALREEAAALESG